MAFTVEDGSRPAGANAYITTAFFDSFHTDRGRPAAVAIADGVKKACIIRASDYIDKRFGRRFRGTRSTHQQEMEWPRLGAVDDSGYVLATVDEIPRRLKQACAEYAMRAAVYSELAPDPLMPVPTQDFTGNELPDPSTDAGPGAVKEIREKVDIVETETIYEWPRAKPPTKAGVSDLIDSAHIPEYPAADMLIESLLTTGQRRLVRGS